MGALVKARRWIREAFEEGSRPPLREVFRWIENEAIPGKIIDGEAFVDADRFAVQSQAPRAANDQPRSGVDLLL